MLETGEKRIIEVSRDRRWGCGCSLHELQAADYGMRASKKLRGTNLQGTTLECARDGLQRMADDPRAEFDMFESWAISTGGTRGGTTTWYGPVTRTSLKGIFENYENFRTRGHWRPWIPGLSDKMDGWLGRRPLIRDSDETLVAFLRGLPGACASSGKKHGKSRRQSWRRKGGVLVALLAALLVAALLVTMLAIATATARSYPMPQAREEQKNGTVPGQGGKRPGDGWDTEGQTRTPTARWEPGPDENDWKPRDEREGKRAERGEHDSRQTMGKEDENTNEQKR